MVSRLLWKCPRCGRRFRNPQQYHSHAGRTPADLLKAKPANVKRLYRLLLGKLRKLGRVRVDAVASGINFGGRAHFAMAAPRRDHLRVGFVLPRKLKNARVLRSEWAGGKNYAHAVAVRTPRDLDGQLMAWLREAYKLRG